METLVNHLSYINIEFDNQMDIRLKEYKEFKKLLLNF